MGRKRAHVSSTASGDRSVIRRCSNGSNVKTAGIVHKIYLENFLCHDNLEILLNENINFITGKNGSGKSAILAGLQVALGERASATSRGNRMNDFVNTGRSQAKVRVTLTNGGPEAFMPDVYGDFISVERTINAIGSGGGYKIMNERGIVISKKKKELDRILAKMNLQVDNPVCILTQEVAKNFLHGNDSKGKYKLFERATQLDVMKRELADGEEDLQRSKSCVKEKKLGLKLQVAELKKWKAKKKWYEDLDSIQDKKQQIKKMIRWAKVEISEKMAETALAQLENLQGDIEKVQDKKLEIQTKLNEMDETYLTRTNDAKEKAQQIREMKAAQVELGLKYGSLTSLKNQIQSEIRCLDGERKRLEKDKADCEKSIEERKRAIGDSEWTRRNRVRLEALDRLKEREEELSAQKKMCEHQVEQIKGAINQLRLDTARSETNSLQSDLDGKTRSLNELRKADGNYHAVFGNWVPALLRLIERTNFSGPKPKGAYIKLRDTRWAPVVENLLGDSLFKFICHNDSDTKVLSRLVDQVMDRNARNRPKIVAAGMTGRMFDVSNNKVQCQHLNEKGIFCLLDMLIIEDGDVANMLIDTAHIEQILLIQEDRDARYYLSDVNKVPRNCKSAITREGNKYYPDPNYKTYCGKVKPSASFLQASVEDAIRNLDNEIHVLKQQFETADRNNRGFVQQLKQNEEQLRAEQSRLDKIRRDLFSISQEKLNLESEAEPEPNDVAALEEDVLDIETKIAANTTEREAKLIRYEDVNQQVKETKTAKMEKDRAVAELVAQADPIKDTLEYMKTKEAEYKRTITRLDEKLVSLDITLKDYEGQSNAAKEKVDLDTRNAQSLAPRMPVTKSLKSLNLELKQITEQVAAREKEFGSRESVFAEYEMRVKDVERSRIEVASVHQTTRKMMQMRKQRKRFLIKFRDSIELRTRQYFQDALKQKRFEGDIDFNDEEKTLILSVTPPGRDRTSQLTSARKKGGKDGIDIRSLSGGERSFATVCFIISLWNAIESPIRVLDEFDVFMDHVNRDFCMRLLLDEARSSVGRQFIFLTPLGLQQDQLNEDISIIKMDDPDRE